METSDGPSVSLFYILQQWRSFFLVVVSYLQRIRFHFSIFTFRFRQAAEIDNRGQRFEAYAQLVNSAIVAPNFTECKFFVNSCVGIRLIHSFFFFISSLTHPPVCRKMKNADGFGLARAPEDLMVALRKGIEDGLKKGPREEKDIPVIHGLNPWFIDRPDLTKRVLNEMQDYTETWSSMELTPVTAYGFRLYRDGSTLDMHIDKSHTHVISFILHIGSSEDAEPWPIVIEDLQGRTHEVVLTSGDVLFYESSKCFHGRPHTFKGSWYSSVFVHYRPTYGWADHPDRWSEKKWAIPPHWSDEPKHHFEPPLEMVGTGMKEPGCPNNVSAIHIEIV